MKALLDGDILLYRVGYTTQDVGMDIAVWRMDELITKILNAVGTEEYKIYLSDSRVNTFRYKICPDYKANRPDEKPAHYEALKEYLLLEWNAEVAVEQEADDLLGIEQTRMTENGEESIICSIDKDLLQIPGHHYNFVKDSFSFITPEEGRLHFYKQLLTGDRVDNVKGIEGIGPAKAAKLLDPSIESEELSQFLLVHEAYKKWLRGVWDILEDEWEPFHEKQVNDIILINGILLKIRTKENELWCFPSHYILSQETVPLL